MIWFKEMPLKLWADTLIRDFGWDNVPVLDDENNWREWGNALVRESSFAKAGCPQTNGFDSLDQWAQAVCGAMADHP